MRTILARGLTASVVVVAAVAGCGGGGDRGDAAAIVVTTSILGDVVHQLVGDAVEVEVVMPPNSDPHDFAPSAKQAQAMRSADVVVVNGLGFEAGLEDTVDAAAGDGATVLTLTDHAPDLLGAEDHEGEDGHEGEADHEGHDHDGADPHVFTDPARMSVAVAALADDLAEHVADLDGPGYRDRVASYLEQLDALDAEIEALVAPIPVAQRMLVTNHDVFGYFADRYDFEVLGSVIPSSTTLAEPSAGDLRALADLIAERGVQAIFAETSSPARLTEALAAEGSEVRVVELFTESLGGPDSEAATYLDLLRTNAERIVAALAPVGAPAG